MQNNLFKFIIRLSVVVLGVLISFYIEKQKALSYKEDLKDQSLRRIINNIEHDIKDSRFNYNIHSKGAKFGRIILNRPNDLFQNDKDSLGYYLKSVSLFGTIFVDNQEEYNTLRNSGLMELIGNDSLVADLQAKYSYHAHFKKIERFMKEQSEELNQMVYKKLSYKTSGRTLYGPYGSYIDDDPLTNYDLNLISHKTGLMTYYAGKIKKSIVQDSLLILDIKKEISLRN